MIRIRNKSSLKIFRRKLRKNQTPAEFALWLCLKNRKLLNKKFVRQYSIHNFIYDFYCYEGKLLIELDGELIHSDNVVYKKDISKERLAHSFGLRILRYKNTDVLNNLENVLDDIKVHLSNTSSSS